MPHWIRWMLVDSSGSRKPLARPSATQFLFQNFLRRPVVKRSKRGSASALAVEIGEQRRGGFVVADEAAAIHIAVADAMLQRNAPLPAGLRARWSACRA